MVLRRFTNISINVPSFICLALFVQKLEGYPQNRKFSVGIHVGYIIIIIKMSEDQSYICPCPRSRRTTYARNINLVSFDR